MAPRIDHFMYAFPDLDEGAAWAERTFGVAPQYGGEHVGLGTRNALLSLDSTYLEIIAPDPAQPLEGTLGETFAQLTNSGLITWAAEGQLERIAQQLSALGIHSIGPNRTTRKTAEGQLLEWELLFPRATGEAGRMPFFIDWLACDNPKDTTPVAGAFESLVVTTQDPEVLAGVMSALALDVRVEAGEPALALRIATEKGTVTLRSTAETRDISLF